MNFDTVKAAFPETELVRGKPCLGDCFVDRILEGVALSFTRRRYGQGGPTPVTYTWVHAWIGGK